MKISYYIVFVILNIPQLMLACSVCYGANADSPIAQGMNMAIITLLGVTGGVLSGFLGFIYYLWNKGKQQTINYINKEMNL